MIVVGAIITAILFAPDATSVTGAIGWSSLNLKEVYKLGIPLPLKMILITHFAIVMWIVWKMTAALRNLFGNFTNGDVFDEQNANHCFKVSRYYLFALVLSYLFTVASNLMLITLYNQTTINWSFSFPIAHLLAISLIYTVGYIVKLAIELDKDARVIV